VKSKTTRLMMYLLVLVIVLPILSLLVVLSLTWPINGWTLEKASALGGSYGILSTLFSGLAFWGLIWTILIQRDEIRRQRIDARRSRISDLLLSEARACLQDLNLIRFKTENSLIFPTEEPFGQWQFFYHASGLMSATVEKEITSETLLKELTSVVMSNIEQFTQFYERLDQACDVARYMLADSEMPIEELREIKLLFFSVFSEDIFSRSGNMKTALQALADRMTEGKGLSLFHPLRHILTKIGSISQFEAQEVDAQSVKSWQRMLGKNRA
jgi:hypothetical protein